MMKLKAALILCLATLSALFLAACGGSSSAENTLIGVSMPSKNLQRWTQDGENIMKQLQAKGYQVSLKNAEDDIPLQVQQIEEMMDAGAKVLVIAAIDGPALQDVLTTAADKHIKVIAYDRLILDTPYIDYYVTFDNFGVGVIQGQFIEEQLGLKDGAGPFNIELFYGSPNDNNAKFFYNGAISILRPYIEDGTLVVPSGQTEPEEISIMDWMSDLAQERMAGLLETYYGDGTPLDAILSPNDGVAYGIIEALHGFGYEVDDFPILTGQDCDKRNVIAMLQGKQSMSVFKDTRSLAARTVEMIDDILVNDTTDVNDTTTYDNGIKIVPTYLLMPDYATAENYRHILIDSGYYTEEDLEIP